jgi:predicted RNase H-like nuclease (RuvC/YqgF family)
MDLASKIKALRQAHSDDIDEASDHEVRLTKEVMTQRAQAQDVEVQLKKRDKEAEELEDDLEAVRVEAQSMI